MMKTQTLTLIASASLLVLAACGPGGSPDPEPITPPENTIADTAGDTMPDLPEPASQKPAKVEMTEAEKAELAEACSTVSADGMCNVSFGMSADEAREAFPATLYGDDSQNASCYYLRPSETSYGRAFMIVDGTVERIDVRDKSVETLLGAGVGVSLNEVEEMYDNTERTPNKYAPANDDLKVDLGDGVFAVFEEDNNGKVRAFRVGQPPAVDYVEGCA